MGTQPAGRATPERLSKRVTGVTEIADLNALCESPHVDHVTLRICDREDLSELGFLSFERARALGRGWDIVDLYVYPEYDNGWALLLDEFPAERTDLEALVSKYPVFASLDVNRSNLDQVRDSLSGAVGMIFELRADRSSFRGNSNTFAREDILGLAEKL